MTTPVQQEDLNWYFVRLTHKNHQQKAVFRSLSESRARAFVERRFPRGSEVYLEHPDGREESYEAERQGDMGTDTEPWQPFDHTTYRSPDMEPPPGETAWADKEG